jgi:hypothetical protein
MKTIIMTLFFWAGHHIEKWMRDPANRKKALDLAEKLAKKTSTQLDDLLVKAFRKIVQ